MSQEAEGGGRNNRVQEPLRLAREQRSLVGLRKYLRPCELRKSQVGSNEVTQRGGTVQALWELLPQGLPGGGDTQRLECNKSG